MSGADRLGAASVRTAPRSGRSAAPEAHFLASRGEPHASRSCLAALFLLPLVFVVLTVADDPAAGA